MGDDRILITKDRVLAFPMYLPLFNFRVQELKDENIRNIIEKIRLFKELFHNEKEKSIIPVVSHSTLDVLFMLYKTNKKGPIETSLIDAEKATPILVASNKMEMIKSPMMMGMDFGCFYKYMLAYSFIFPKSDIASYWDCLKKNIKTILENIPIYEINLPMKYSMIISEQLNQLIKDLK